MNYDEYVFLVGIMIGIPIGICLTLICFKLNNIRLNNNNILDNNTDSNNSSDSNYIKYLEEVLNNSTNVTTESYSLYDVNRNVDIISNNNVTQIHVEPESGETFYKITPSGIPMPPRPPRPPLPSAPPLET